MELSERIIIGHVQKQTESETSARLELEVYKLATLEITEEHNHQYNHII